MRLDEILDVKTPSVKTIADKHGVSVKKIKSQLKKGIEVEREHTSDCDTAEEIALDHLNELPDYYDRLAKIEEPIKEDVRQMSNSILSKYPELQDFHIFMSRNEPDVLWLDNIIVNKESRKSGIGGQVMDDLVKYADKNNLTLMLTPALKDDHHGTTSRGRLVNFYKRFGFVQNKGRNKEFKWPADSMYRLPR